MIENWARPGMPPEEYDVLKREPIPNPESGSITEYIWLRGEHPNKGTVINGFTGRETFVEVYFYPGLRPRFIKDYIQQLPESHPLHDWQIQRAKERKALSSNF